MFTFSFLCALTLFTALQVPGTLGTVNRLTIEKKDQEKIVALHNNVRRNVVPEAANMVEMVWNQEAADHAQEWAEMCDMSHSLYEFRKIATSDCGENLFMSSHKKDWDHVIKSWADDEAKDWVFGEGPTRKDAVVGHLIQIIWYNSNQVGCGIAHCPNTKYEYHMVCHYCPPGNFQNTHPYVPGRPCELCPDDCKDRLCIANNCPYQDRFSNCRWLVNDYGCLYFFAIFCQKSCFCKDMIV